MYQKKLLDNGLRVITCNMPHTRSVTVAIFIGAGSRYESQEKAGVFHFIEHLCFKGASRRTTAREISEAIDGVGGIINGGTDKELTVFWCKVTVFHLALALDVLSDIILYSKFDPLDVETERQVIVEEINMSQDSPQYRVDLLSDELIWPGCPLGIDTAGTKETVGALTRSDMWDHLTWQYLPNNTVISIAGNIDHDEVVSQVESVFGDWQPGVALSWQPAPNNQKSPRICIESRDTEQAHLCLAVRGLPLDHPDRYALDMLSIVLGEGMSSRLFTEIRERLGLAYAVHATSMHFLDSGALVIGAGVAPDNLPDTVTAILGELGRLKHGVPQDELMKAKGMRKGRLLLRMEDSHDVATWLGAQDLLLGKAMTVDDAISVIDSIQADDMQRVAQELMVTDKLSLAVVGPVHNKGQLKKLLKL